MVVVAAAGAPGARITAKQATASEASSGPAWRLKPAPEFWQQRLARVEETLLWSLGVPWGELAHTSPWGCWCSITRCDPRPHWGGFLMTSLKSKEF